MTIVSIEGNIGSGKSTLINRLKQHYAGRNDIIFLDEPLEEWGEFTDEVDRDIFTLFNSYPNNYSLTFQLVVMHTMFTRLVKTQIMYPDALIICERSIQTGMDVFAEALRRRGEMKQIEYDALKLYGDHLRAEVPRSGIIYVNTSPIDCARRIISRNRDGERIGITYLQHLDDLYSVAVENAETEHEVVLNGEHSAENNLERVVQYLERYFNI